MLIKKSQYCFLISLLFLLLSCSDDKNYSESYLRGKRIYKANCVKCHNYNPSKIGVLAPNIEGSSLETIQSMLLYGKPPEEQIPRWSHVAMDPLPHLIKEAPFLFDYIDSFKK